jgi:hypothetical protein
MKNRIRAIRVVIKSTRNTSKTKTERVLRLRMLMEECRSDLYGSFYDFQLREIAFINFLTIFTYMCLSIQFFRSELDLQYALIGVVASSMLGIRKLNIYRHRTARGRREYLKTKRVLGFVEKSELQKLDNDIRDWYMIKKEFSDAF